MRKHRIIAVLACMVLCMTGCAADRSAGEAGFAESRPKETELSEIHSSRILTWGASLSIEVRDVDAAAQHAEDMAKKYDGRVESKSERGEEYMRLILRVSTRSLSSAIGDLESLGKVTRRSISSRDITEEYIDVDARLKNMIVLRDRLKQLLEKADEVKDVLAIEKELNRVQADIDSLEGRFKALKGQVDLATIDLTLERKIILGPLGYLFKALGWGIEKLFVLRR
jgi:hypothetical protein